MSVRARDAGCVLTPSLSPSCLTGYYVQVVLIMFFLVSSDIFITLRCAEFHSALPGWLMRRRPRIYAITSGKTIFAVYFGTLALARLTVALATSFTTAPTIANFPPLPVDATHLCVIVIDLQFKLAPNSIATAFGGWFVRCDGFPGIGY